MPFSNNGVVCQYKQLFKVSSSASTRIFIQCFTMLKKFISEKPMFFFARKAIFLKMYDKNDTTKEKNINISSLK